MLTYADYQRELAEVQRMYLKASELRDKAAQRGCAARVAWLARDRQLLVMRGVVVGEFEEVEA